MIYRVLGLFTHKFQIYTDCLLVKVMNWFWILFQRCVLSDGWLSDRRNFLIQILVFNHVLPFNHDLLLQIFIPSTFFFKQLPCGLYLLLKISRLLSPVPMLVQTFVSHGTCNWRHMHPLFSACLLFSRTKSRTKLNRVTHFRGEKPKINASYKFYHCVNFLILFRS